MKKIIIANWKMHPDTADEAARLARDTERALPRSLGADVVIAPPFPFLVPVRAVLTRISLASQDVSGHEQGAHTGEVSWQELVATGVKYAIIGHSERRMHSGETEDMINRKIRTALGHSIGAILCVGERERVGADIPPIVSEQVRSALASVRKEMLKNLIVAYEPVWAISTSAGAPVSDTPERMFRARLTIEKEIAACSDAASAKKVRIIYGGSVAADTISVIIREGRMDGALVGGASLDPQGFGAIVRRATEAGK